MRPAPNPIRRPCEWGLLGTVNDMENQLGTIEAYNMLVAYANKLKTKIDNGNAKAQLSIFATDIMSAS